MMRSVIPEMVPAGFSRNSGAIPGILRAIEAARFMEYPCSGAIEVALLCVAPRETSVWAAFWFA